MQFDYRARNMEGKLLSGKLEAANEKEVLDILGAKDLLVVELKVATQKAGDNPKSKVRVALTLLAPFTRQLATMLRAGLPLMACLGSLRRQAKDRGLQTVTQDLIVAVENGASLSEALSLHSGVFSSLYVNIVKAGETGGVLTEVLDRLAGYLEASLRLRQKIRSAMIYPAIVCVLGLGICIFMLTAIIPVFVDIFKEFDHALPLPTLILINTSNAVRTHWLVCLVAGIIFFWSTQRFRRTPDGTQLWDRLRLRLPVFGPLASKIVFSRFSRTLATLEHSGVPVLKALQTSAFAVNNVVVQAAIMRIAEDIEHGSSFLEAMERRKMFPSMMLEMVAAGERSGAVDEMLAQVADHYDREIEAALAGLTSMLEPILILFLGIVVGSVVVAMFLPIFKMTDAIQF